MHPEHTLIIPGCEIVFVRHFLSEANVAIHQINKHHSFDKSELLRHVPHPQYRLTPKGREKGERIGKFIRDTFETFDWCYCSDMDRAIESALIINEPGGYYATENRYLGWEVDGRIRERFWGDLEQPGWEHKLLVAAHDRRRRGLDAHNLVLPNGKSITVRLQEDIFTWQPPNGEHFAVTMQRACDLLREIHARKFRRVLVVSHGDFILACIAVIENKTSLDTNGNYLWRSDIPSNGGIFHYRRNDMPASNPKAHNPLYFDEVRETAKGRLTKLTGWRKIFRGCRTPEEMRAFIAQHPNVLSTHA